MNGGFLFLLGPHLHDKYTRCLSEIFNDSITCSNHWSYLLDPYQVPKMAFQKIKDLIHYLIYLYLIIRKNNRKECREKEER